MKVTNRAGMVWAVAIFVLVGAILVVVALTLGGDETDMEQQPELIVPSLGAIAGALAGAGA